MKTAERILVTSLALFNERGEGNVSSVDIALELDISPGNLYYHFKGKEVIVAALFDLYQSKLTKVLHAGRTHELDINEFFYFLLLLLEQAQLFQFLTHNPADLANNYPQVGKAYNKLLIAQEQCIAAQLQRYAEHGQIKLTGAALQQLTELIGLVFSQAANYYSLKGQDIRDEEHLYKCLASILFVTLPHMKFDQSELTQLQQAIHDHTLAEELHSRNGDEETDGDSLFSKDAYID